MRNKDEKQHGFNKPNTVPTPDEFYDIALRECTGAEAKVLAIVINQTYRFNKKWDWISLSQFQKKTNLSRHAVINSLNSLENAGWILTSYQCRECGYSHKERFRTCPGCHTKLPPAKLTTAMISNEMFSHLTKIFQKPPKQSKPFDYRQNESGELSAPLDKITYKRKEGSELNAPPQCTECTTPENGHEASDSKENLKNSAQEGSELSAPTGNQETKSNKSSSSLRTCSDIRRGIKPKKSKTTKRMMMKEKEKKEKTSDNFLD